MCQVSQKTDDPGSRLILRFREQNGLKSKSGRKQIAIKIQRRPTAWCKVCDWDIKLEILENLYFYYLKWKMHLLWLNKYWYVGLSFYQK